MEIGFGGITLPLSGVAVKHPRDYDRDLRAYPPAEAERVMASAIRHLAAEHGAPDKYHATMPHAWVKLVAVHRRELK